MITSLVWFTAGVAAGLAGAVLFRIHQARSASQIADALKSEFQSLSLSALSQSTGELLKLANEKFQGERELNSEQLDSKSALIDQQLAQMTAQLGKVSEVMASLEKDREAKFGQLTNQLSHSNETARALLETTGKLKEALSGSKARGQLGELMAENVLHAAGLVENQNYVKQKSIAGVGSKPDFTFLLPRHLKLNMDVKFPFDNYVKFMQSESPADKEKFHSDFFKDVKAKIKEVTSREYINPEQNTLNCVILLIANESVYSFIYQEEPEILNLALRERVIMCSPVTLLGVLAVVKQTMDNFNLGQTSNEILELLDTFKTQWYKFLDKLETVGKRIDDAQKEYQDLTTTRKKQLEKPLNKIGSLQKGLPSSAKSEVLELPGRSNGQAD